MQTDQLIFLLESTYLFHHFMILQTWFLFYSLQTSHLYWSCTTWDYKTQLYDKIIEHFITNTFLPNPKPILFSRFYFSQVLTVSVKIKPSQEILENLWRSRSSQRLDAQISSYFYSTRITLIKIHLKYYIAAKFLHYTLQEYWSSCLGKVFDIKSI